MNPLFNLILMSLFIASNTYLVVDIEDYNDLIKNKFVFFLAIFFFQSVLMVISDIVNNCKINMGSVVNSSIRVALIGVIGYSVYSDLTMMDYTRDFFKQEFGNEHKSNWLCTAIIIMFISILKLFELLLTSSQYDCVE